jgi:hypothetical protein
MSQELLEGRWSETKDALMEGLSGSKRNSMNVILENTRKYLKENASAGSTSSGNIATLNRVILPVIRRVMPTVIANELVGVQPMTGPVGQIHTLRVRYAQMPQLTQQCHKPLLLLPITLVVTQQQWKAQAVSKFQYKS